MTSTDSRAQIRQAYDAVAHDYAALIPDLGVESPLDLALLDAFAQRCAETPSSPVADIGCGAGRITAHLTSLGIDAFGVDLSPRMIDVAQLTHPQVHFEVGAMEHLKLPDATLGGLLAWYSLIHTAPEHLAGVLDEFARVTKTDGWLLTGFQSGNGQRVERTEAYGHQVALTNYRHDPQHIRALLVRAGFDVSAELHRQPEGAERSQQAILLARRVR